jgi:hypothetical protein
MYQPKMSMMMAVLHMTPPLKLTQHVFFRALSEYTVPIQDYSALQHFIDTSPTSQTPPPAPLSQASTSASTASPHRPTPPPQNPSPDPSDTSTTIFRRTHMATKSVKINIENLKFLGHKSNFQEWKDMIDLYMIANPAQFANDQAKVAFALSWVCGTDDAKV